MYAPDESHGDARISYFEDALHRVHTRKDVPFLGRDGTKEIAKGNALRSELVKNRTVNVKTHADTWMPSK
jgi:hypothetical protein